MRGRQHARHNTQRQQPHGEQHCCFSASAAAVCLCVYCKQVKTEEEQKGATSSPQPAGPTQALSHSVRRHAPLRLEVAQVANRLICPMRCADDAC